MNTIRFAAGCLGLGAVGMALATWWPAFEQEIVIGTLALATVWLGWMLVRRHQLRSALGLVSTPVTAMDFCLLLVAAATTLLFGAMLGSMLARLL